MAFFDKMFGSGAAAAAAVTTSESRFTELKHKYAAVLDSVDKEGVQLQNLHVQDNKLYIRGTAATQAGVNAVWDKIKEVDQNWAEDLTAELSVSDQAANTVPYTVKAGDSLWRIAQHELGDGQEYMKIFYANRDKLETPNSVFHPGSVLNIPKG